MYFRLQRMKCDVAIVLLELYSYLLINFKPVCFFFLYLDDEVLCGISFVLYRCYFFNYFLIYSSHPSIYPIVHQSIHSSHPSIHPSFYFFTFRFSISSKTFILHPQYIFNAPTNVPFFIASSKPTVVPLKSVLWKLKYTY